MFHSIDFNTAYVYAVLVETIVNDNIHYLDIDGIFCEYMKMLACMPTHSLYIN